MSSMKNLVTFMVYAVLVILSASCVKEANSEFISSNTRRYYLSFSASTKTEISGTGNSRQVNWTEGDSITYYTESGQDVAATSAVTVNESYAYVQIPRGRTDEFINAVYGAYQLKGSSSTENTMYITSTVKNAQRFTSFAEAHLCAAFSNDIENPELRFHNAVVVLRFTSSSSIHKVVFYGNDNEIITGGESGDLKISYSSGELSADAASTGGSSVTVATNGEENEFFIAIIPVTFSHGFTVDCYDAKQELVASQKTSETVRTMSNSGTPKVINLGSILDWLANPQPVAVDLGLSVKWARCNLGATEPEQYGNYYAWGETSPKNEYKWANYKYGSSKNGPFSKYVLESGYGEVDHKTVLDLEDDAAYAEYGGFWRMPTQKEVEELMNGCTWVWTTRNDIPGYKVTSITTGNSIFLPANGMFGGSSANDAGIVGNYWSASLSKENTYFSVSPYFASSYIRNGNCYRYLGLAVRPVYKEIIPVSSIVLPASLDLVIGRSACLNASILPENATFKGIAYDSSDTSVVTVDANGIVQAVTIGSATITAYSEDASVTANCIVNVVPIPEPEAVDLGLSVKWATFNVGAITPEEYGDYFAWGETEPKTNYDWSTYKWCNGSSTTPTKYINSSKYGEVDNKTVLDLEDDAAFVNWGNNWRMPTDAEWTELKEECTWTYTVENGINGYKITSKKDGYNGSIYLPFAGYTYGADYYSVGISGDYWSSTPTMSGAPVDAWSCYFTDYGLARSNDGRCSGFTVRPVYDNIVHHESVILNKSTLTLYVGGSEQLTATISPANATVTTVSWSSDNTSVVKVDANGVVTALSAGTTIITVTTNKGLTASCSVEVLPTPEITDYGRFVVGVDMGLSVKWASFNIGAARPDIKGDFFAWGETETKSNFGSSNYRFSKGSGKYSKYCLKDDASHWAGDTEPDGITKLNPEDDAANVIFGGGWRMPTEEEWQELKDNCTTAMTYYSGSYGQYGIWYTSKKNGNNIFLPAIGYKEGYDIRGNGADGYYNCIYWASTLNVSKPPLAYSRYTSNGGITTFSTNRHIGMAVRPVSSNYDETKVSYIVLSSSLTVFVGQSRRLMPTIYPETAVNKDVTWSSSDISVASVDQNGVISGVNTGTAIITCKSVADGISAQCEVNVGSLPELTDLGKSFEAIDLGLSVKWASFNIGAQKAEDYGSYYSWAGKTKYVQNNAPYAGSSGYKKYCTRFFNTYWSGSGQPDNILILEPSDDIANISLGGDWHIPSVADWSELIENCEFTWTKLNETNGYEITSKINGNSIFLPASSSLPGSGMDPNVVLYYDTCEYWAAELNIEKPNIACSFWGDRFTAKTYSLKLRSNGLTIRPVIAY